MSVIIAFAGLAFGGVLIVIGAVLISYRIRSLAYLILTFGILFIFLAAIILAGQPTGQSWEVIPPHGTYQAKVVLIGEEEGPYQGQVLVMLWLPNHSIKTYRIRKDRFLEPKKLVSSDELVEVRVFRPAEYAQRMLNIVPQAP